MLLLNASGAEPLSCMKTSTRWAGMSGWSIDFQHVEQSCVGKRRGWGGCSAAHTFLLLCFWHTHIQSKTTSQLLRLLTKWMVGHKGNMWQQAERMRFKSLRARCKHFFFRISRRGAFSSQLSLYSAAQVAPVLLDSPPLLILNSMLLTQTWAASTLCLHKHRMEALAVFLDFFPAFDREYLYAHLDLTCKRLDK